MELENLTPHPALLARGGVDEERLFGSVFARVTYDVVDGRLEPASEPAWDVSPGPWDSDYGPMDADEVFYREGVDVMVFGSARAPRGNPVPWLELSVGVGSFSRTLWVWGERYWVRSGAGLVVSEPTPFVELPLTLEHAFGGAGEWDELPIPYPDNPDGTGFYLDEETAEGGPLTRIEDPAHAVARWDDRPEPVGTGATTLQFGPRARRAASFDDETGEMTRLHPRFFNSAFPDMIAPDAGPGDTVRVAGVRTDGPFEFRLPPTPLRVYLRFGEEEAVREPYVDQIGIEPDLERVFVAYRYPFRYRLVALQARHCVLFREGDDLSEFRPAADEGRNRVEEGGTGT